MVESIVGRENYYDERAEEKLLICFTCGGEVNVLPGPEKSKIYLHCPICNAELDRLSELIIEKVDLYDRYAKALNRLEEVSQLYQTLQDHLKCLLT